MRPCMYTLATKLCSFKDGCVIATQKTSHRILEL
jgi:hypothetical protein